MAIREPGTRWALAALLVAAACAGPVDRDARRSGTGGRSGGLADVPVVDGDLRIECAGRRAALAAALGGPGVVVLAAPPAPPDGRFFQDDDLLYVSGVDQPDIVVLLAIGADGALVDEVLLLPPHDPTFELWNGPRLQPGAEAEAATGFRRTDHLPGPEPGRSLDGILAALAADLGPATLHVLGETDLAPPGLTPDPDQRLRAALTTLRHVKSPYEIACLRAAIDITVAALHEAFAATRPGMWEFQAQAAIDGTFLRLGSERPGFSSICGSGPWTTVLHYDRNRRQTRDGDLLLMDVGAKFRGYCADVTRTIPVNGRFSPRQREVYGLVLEAQAAAEAIARPGVTIRDLHEAARQVFLREGLDAHFKHTVGHWIGLDVHDVGGRRPIAVNSLFTIEPGLYLADEGLGIRIEDDYLMTADGPVKLSAGIPSDPDAIEALLAGPR